MPEPTQTEALLNQHEQQTGQTVATVVGGQQYGTTDNLRQMQERGVRTRLKTTPGRPADATRFAPEKFSYDVQTDRYQCPAGKKLFPRTYNPRRQTTEYLARKGVCAACPLRAQCTDSPNGRHITRHRLHDLVLCARAEAQSRAARHDYSRHRHLIEGSFEQAANCHGCKRARWRRLWRQQIQDWKIATVQNIKTLIKTTPILPQRARDWLRTFFLHQRSLAALFVGFFSINSLERDFPNELEKYPTTVALRLENHPLGNTPLTLDKSARRNPYAFIG